MKTILKWQSRLFVLPLLITLGLPVAGLAAPAQTAPPNPLASTSRDSILGSEIKIIQPSGSLGVLYGWRYIAFENDRIGFGGAGFTGQLGESNGSFSYGGFQMNYLFHKSEHSGTQIGLLAGGGGGTVDSTTFGGVLLEPQMMFSWNIGNTVRTSLAGSYLWMPGSTSYSAPAVAIRFDFLLNKNN